MAPGCDSRGGPALRCTVWPGLVAFRLGCWDCDFDSLVESHRHRYRANSQAKMLQVFKSPYNAGRVAPAKATGCHVSRRPALPALPPCRRPPARCVAVKGRTQRIIEDVTEFPRWVSRGLARVRPPLRFFFCTISRAKLIKISLQHLHLHRHPARLLPRRHGRRRPRREPRQRVVGDLRHIYVLGDGCRGIVGGTSGGRRWQGRWRTSRG